MAKESAAEGSIYYGEILFESLRAIAAGTFL